MHSSFISASAALLDRGGRIFCQTCKTILLHLFKRLAFLENLHKASRPIFEEQGIHEFQTLFLGDWTTVFENCSKRVKWIRV